MRKWGLVVTAWALLATTTNARAGDLDFDFSKLPPVLAPHADVGFASMSNVAFGGGDGTSGSGIHVEEHNGLFARVFTLVTVGLPVMAFVSLTRKDKNVRVLGYVEGPEQCYMERVQTCGPNGEYRDSDKNYHPCTYTEVKRCSRDKQAVVEVTELTPEQRAEQRAQDKKIDEAGSKLAALTMTFNLLYLPALEDKKLHGVRASLYPVGIPIAGRAMISLGLEGARFHREVMETDGPRQILHRSRALALRVTIAPVSWATAFGEVFANWLQVSQENDPSDRASVVRGGLTLAIPKFERIYGKLVGEHYGIGGNGPWGTSIEVGARF